MTQTTIDAPDAPTPTVGDRALDAARRIAHASHEAELVRSLASDAIEDGVHAVKRAVKRVKRSVEHAQDLREEAAYRVRRQPLKAIGIAASVGAAVGIALGWIVGRSTRARA